MADPWPDIGNPGTGYLGLGPAGYYIGRYLLGGAAREEEAQQRALMNAIEVLRRTQPSTRTTWEDVPPQGGMVVPSGQEFPPLDPELVPPREFPREPSVSLSDLLFPEREGAEPWMSDETLPRLSGEPDYAAEQFSLYPGMDQPHRFVLPELPQLPEDTAPTVEVAQPAQPAPTARPLFPGMVKETERVSEPEPVEPPPTRPVAPTGVARAPAPAPARRQVAQIVPGESLTDIAISNPRTLPFILKGLSDFQKVEEANREAQARQAMELAFRQAKQRTAQPGVPSALTELQNLRQGLLHSMGVMLQNPELLTSDAALKVATRLKDVSGMLDAVEKGQQSAEERTLQRQFFLRLAQEAHARNDPVAEQLYLAGAVSKDAAEMAIKIRDKVAEETIRRGPVGKWKGVKEIVGEDVALELMSTPGLEPHMLNSEIIRNAAANANAKQIILKKAGVPNVLTPAEAEDVASQFSAAYNFERIADEIEKDPRGWGGPMGLNSFLDRVAASLGLSTERNMEMRNTINQFGSLIRKSIAGTAVSNQEAKYVRWIPTGNEGSVPELIAKLRTSAANIQRTLRIRAHVRKHGYDEPLPPDLFIISTPDKGDVDVRTYKPTPEGGRTEDSQGAADRLKAHGVFR